MDETLSTTEAPLAEAAEHTEQATGLLGRFLKALKAFRLYEKNHRTLTGFIEEFHSNLTEFMTTAGDFALRVTQFQIAFDDEPIYENTVKEESLSFRLFIHGVREITFHPGAEIDEVVDFLQIIHAAFDGKSSVEDLLTRLWERDFAHINFIILDDFFEEGEEVEFQDFVDNGERADRTAESMRRSVQPLLDEIVLRQMANQSERDTVPLDEMFRLEEAETKRLAEWVEEDRRRDVITDLSEVILTLIDPSEADEEEEDLLAILDRLFHVLLDEGRILDAARIAAELHEAEANTESEKLKAIVRDGLANLDEARILEALEAKLRRGMRDDCALLGEFLRSMGGDATRRLVDLLADPDLREAVQELLAQMVGGDVSQLLTQNAGKAPAVLLPLIRIAGSPGDHKALAALRFALTHPDPTVRREAVRATGRVGTAAAYPLLNDRLSDDNEDVRALAIRNLASIPNGAHVEEILEMADGNAFARRSSAEKREILFLVGSLDDHRADEVLARVLAKRPWFKREAYQELRVAAAGALGRRNTIDALTALSRHEKDPAAPVRQAVARALIAVQSNRA